MNLSHEAFEKCDRQFVNIFNYEDHYKRKFSSTDSEEHVAAAKLMKDQFEHDLIQDIPKQIEKFFELQQFDVEEYEEEKTIQRQQTVTVSDTHSMISLQTTKDRSNSDVTRKQSFEIPLEFQ